MHDGLPHLRWLIGHLTRDEGGSLIVDPVHYETVSKYIFDRLEDKTTRASVLEETLSLAHGASSEGQEIELARQLVQLLLLHPAGAAHFDSRETDDVKFLRFTGKGQQKSAPQIDKAVPEGTVKLSSFLEPGEADRRGGRPERGPRKFSKRGEGASESDAGE